MIGYLGLSICSEGEYEAHELDVANILPFKVVPNGMQTALEKKSEILRTSSNQKLAAVELSTSRGVNSFTAVLVLVSKHDASGC